MTPDITIRAAHADDAQYIVDVCAAAHARRFVHTPRLDEVLAKIAATNAVSFIGESQDRRCGLIRLIGFDNPWLVEVGLLVADPPGTGAGTAMLRWAQRYAFDELRAHRMYLQVGAHNDGARRLYERLGFVREGLFRDGFRGDDGAYQDLFSYGLLEDEYRAHVGAV